MRVVNGGPLPFYRAALVSLAVTSALVIVIALRIRPHGLSAAPQRDMGHTALVLLGLSVALGIASLLVRGRVRPAWVDRAVAPQERAVIWLALAAWLPCLAIVAYYRAEATFPPSVPWINFGYDDKRWVTAAYLVCVLAPMLFLVGAAYVLRVARDHPPGWRAWLAGLLPRGRPDTAVAPSAGHAAGDGETAPAGQRPRAVRILRVAAGIAAALALAWYFLGPPWYLSQTKTRIGYQEDVFLVGFQAMARGHLPYIGVAGVQYGPGAQLISYWFMRHVASFSVVGFRESWAAYQWIGASVLFVVFFLAFGYARGLAASLLCVLVYPGLHGIAFQPGGSFDGFWAWANPLRYVGAITLIVLLPAAIRRCPSWRGVASGFALGVVWGVMSYMAQENLVAGGAGALLIGALVLLTGTFSWRMVRAGLAAVVAGFLLVWLPVLNFYADHGQLGQFLNLYFLIPRAVAGGYSDTPWQGTRYEPFPLTTMFFALPFVLAVLGLLAVVQFRPFKIGATWSRDRTLLAATVLVTILLYQGALLRSDAAHMTGTLLVVPALVIMASTVLPGLLGGHRRLTLIAAGTAIAAASFALLPLSAFTAPSVRAKAEAPYLDRQALAAGPRPAAVTTLAGQRVGAGLAHARVCCQGGRVSMPRFIGAMDRLHAIIGSRTTYVADVPHGYPGLAYFVADLTPAPVRFDEYTTVLNEPQLQAYMAYFRTSVLPRIQALVTVSLAEPQAQLFIERYPHVRLIIMRFADKPCYVLVRPPRQIPA